MNRNETKYIISEEIMECGLLLPVEILCYVLIKTFSNEKGEYILKQKDLAQKLNVCENTIKKSIKKLIKMEFISKEESILMTQVRKSILKIL